MPSGDLGQSATSRRGTIRLLSTGPIHVEGNLGLRVGEPLEVVRVDDVLALIQRLPKREAGGERLTASDFAGLLEASLRGRSET